MSPPNTLKGGNDRNEVTGGRWRSRRPPVFVNETELIDRDWLVPVRLRNLSGNLPEVSLDQILCLGLR